MKNKTIILAVVIGLTFLLYFPSLRGEFQFDDDIYITENEMIRQPLKPLEQGILSFLLSGSRPLTQLTLNFNYALGGFRVEGYHLFNILIHLAVTVLLYILSRRIFSGLGGSSALFGNSEMMALTAAGLFALHPLQTQTVSYVIQRAESLASLFYLLCIFCLLRFIRSTGWQQWLWWFLGMASFALGWGSKEIIVTVPAVILLHAVFFMDRAAATKAVKGIAPFLFGCLFMGSIVILRFRGSDEAGFDMQGLGQPEYFYTQMRVLITYLRLIFFPAGQTLDYDYPIYREFFRWEVIGPMAFWVATVLLSVYSLRATGRWKGHTRLMGFGMLWFIVILLPTSSLIPLRDVIYEHRAYLAMFGVVIAVLAAADLIILKAAVVYGNRVYRTAVAIAAGLMIVLAVLTGMRNTIWQTKLSLWQDVVEKSPGKARGHNNLGNCYYLAGNYEKAIEAYKAALQRDPNFVESYFNMAISFKRLGKEAEAEIAGLMYNEKVMELRKLNTP